MDTGGDLHSVVGSGVQGVGEAGAAKVGVILGLNVAVPLLHGLCEGSCIDAHSLAQLLVGSAGDGVALLDVALDDAGSIDHGLIDDQPAVAAGLSDLSGGDDVTGADLVDEALAFLVDEDSAVAAQALGDEGSGVGLNGGVDLDLVHVHGSSADGLSHLDALALDAGGVGGHEALQLGLVLDDHVEVCTEAAGSQNDCLGVDGDGLTGSTGGLDAHGSAVGIGQDLSCSGVQHHLDAGLLAVLLQQGDHVGADGNGLALCVHRAMDALDGCTAEAGDVVQGDAVLVQPVDGVSRVCAQGLDQLGVVDALAADHGIQLHQLDRVEVAGGVGLIGSPLLGDGLCQSGDGLVVGVLLGSSLQGLLDAGRLAELVLVLINRLAGVHAAGSADGVTAHHGLALEDDDGLALSGSGDGSSHACAACTDDDDICVNGGVLGGSVVLHSDLVVIGVQAGSGQGSCSSLLDGGRGDGSARHAVHGDAAALGDLAGHLGDGLRADALGLFLALGGAAGDGAVGQGQGDGNVAAEALGSAGEVAGHTCVRTGRGRLCTAAVAKQADRDDRCHSQCRHALFDLSFLHDFPSLLTSWFVVANIYQHKKGAALLQAAPSAELWKRI